MSSTHEHEITHPVDLCRADGRTLSPAARGWSRVPLHTANLRGGWGRTKRWDYWCVLARDLAISVTYADVDYLGMAHVWWVDLASGRSGGGGRTVPLARGIALPDRPGTAPLCHAAGRAGRAMRVEIVDDAEGTAISAEWRESGVPARLDVRIDLPPGHESLNVVIPWSDRRFQYTSKHQARPARGQLVVGSQVRRFGVQAGAAAAEGADEAWGVLDVGRGRWPYRTQWNWGGGAGRSRGGPTVGLQLGAKWTEGTGFTENGVLVDGRLTKIGEELEWSYDWDRPMRPWRVRHPDGSLELRLAPRYDRHDRTHAIVLSTEVHQVFGTWTGHVTDEAGVRHEVADIVGFAEESRSRW